MPQVEVAGRHLHVDDTGGEGPPIVLSPGAAADHQRFVPQVTELARTHRVITWDPRGTSAGVDGGTALTPDDAARDLFGVLDALGIERAILAGAGQGGALSLHAALLHPDRVRALVLIATSPQAADVARLEEVDAPTLLVHGREDATVPLAQAEQVRTGLPECRGLVVVDGAAHAPHLTHPEVVNPALRDFVDGLPA